MPRCCSCCVPASRQVLHALPKCCCCHSHRPLRCSGCPEDRTPSDGPAVEAAACVTRRAAAASSAAALRPGPDQPPLMRRCWEPQPRAAEQQRISDDTGNHQAPSIDVFDACTDLQAACTSSCVHVLLLRRPAECHEGFRDAANVTNVIKVALPSTLNSLLRASERMQALRALANGMTYTMSACTQFCRGILRPAAHPTCYSMRQTPCTHHFACSRPADRLDSAHSC